MANRIENLKLIISGDGKLLGAELGRTERQVKGWGGRVGGIFGGIRKKIASSIKGFATNPLAVIGGTGAVVYAGKQLIDYQDKLSSLGLMTGKTDAEIVRMDNDMTQMAYDTGQSRDKIVDAIADMADKTGDAEFSFRAMFAAAKASTGMSADLADVTRVVSSLRLGMGATADEVEEYLDVMARMGNVGSFVFRDQAAQAERLFSSGAMAIKLTKRSFAEYNAFMQMIKPSFGSADMAGTAIDSIINRFRSDQGAIEKAVHFKIFDEKGAIIDFAKTIKALGKLKPKLQKELFGEYSRAFTVFDNDDAATQYDKMIEAGQKAGFVTEAFTKKSREAKYQINAMMTAAMEFADAGLSPAIAELTGRLAEITNDPQKMAAFRAELHKFGETAASVAVAVGPLLQILENFATLIQLLPDYIKIKGIENANAIRERENIGLGGKEFDSLPLPERWKRIDEYNKDKDLFVKNYYAEKLRERTSQQLTSALSSLPPDRAQMQYATKGNPLNLDQKITVVAPEGTRVMTENRGAGVSANTQTNVNRGAF